MPDDRGDGLPSYCLRGLRRKDWIVDSNISALAFAPEPSTSAHRDDGMAETSINWEDDETAIAFTLERRGHSEHGVARLPREEIDHIRRLQSCIAKLEYERRALDDNPFHGNLLYAVNCGKPLERMIAGFLALASEHIPRS